MYAVLKTGGKQYRVEPGQVLRVEKLEAEEGATVRFDEVLMVGGAETAIGAPLVAGAAVEAEVLGQVKADKVISFVRRRRKHSSKRTRGHRQRLTVLRVTGIRPSDGAEMVRAAAVDEAAADTSLDAEAADAGDDAALEAGEKPQFLDAPRGEPDDLTRIKGVGPKLAGILREIGVFHFDQIAGWSDEEVAYMDARLSFKGRIGREGWIEQARRLAAEPAASEPAQDAAPEPAPAAAQDAAPVDAPAPDPAPEPAAMSDAAAAVEAPPPAPEPTAAPVEAPATEPAPAPAPETAAEPADAVSGDLPTAEPASEPAPAPREDASQAAPASDAGPGDTGPEGERRDEDRAPDPAALATPLGLAAAGTAAVAGAAAAMLEAGAAMAESVAEATEAATGSGDVGSEDKGGEDEDDARGGAAAKDDEE